MRDDEGDAALHECVDGLLHKIAPTTRQGPTWPRPATAPWGEWGGSWGTGHGCEYLEEKMVVVVVVVVVVACFFAPP